MIFSTAVLRRVATISAATFAMSVGSLTTSIAQAVTLNGAGATFPKPLYDRYFAEIQSKTGIQINYEAIGSGGGIRQFIAGTTDFGGTDAPPSADDIAQMEDGLILVPTAGGAVAVVYNLPGVDNLKITREALPKIFSGEISRWNDPAITSANPGVTLPNKPIRVSVRADGSGTTFIFTRHLAALSNAFIATKSPDEWPSAANVQGGRGNSGVAALVQQNEGAIGYVQASYAAENDMKYALLQNKSLEFVAPIPVANADLALETMEFSTEDNHFIPQGLEDPEQGYSIVGVTWLMIKENYGDSDKAEAIETMVQWILEDGQDINNDLQYTRIPGLVAADAIAAVSF
ncbi:MAG: phosphate ABC transporter substrate-binding protein PstS [Cyanobacteria bacterium SID2]|nr:phosphate ABC transporter substrate-binding protein PstS [Cyanobacteria bacterium SID2]MBP0003476.1 phosphate ABC transporter substrate-binding protein PstS [Cyanobacteria bacterium SBC]